MGPSLLSRKNPLSALLFSVKTYFNERFGILFIHRNLESGALTHWKEVSEPGISHGAEIHLQ